MVDPNETPETKRKHELLQCYRRGWKHGACHRMKDPRFTDHDRSDIRVAYDRGYRHGEEAAFSHAWNESERLGYDARLSMLRAAIPDREPPTVVDGECMQDCDAEGVPCPKREPQPRSGEKP